MGIFTETESLISVLLDLVKKETIDKAKHATTE